MLVRPVEWQGLDWGAVGEFVRFRQPALMPNGNRSILYPTVSWTKQGSAWFFTAQTGLHMTNYDLDNTTVQPTSFNRVLPITSVDTGLVFERETDWFGRSFVQTLEPRAYYVYIPYKNQSTYPNFDTAQDDFNFSHLFTANRYLGWDRIGDAMQQFLPRRCRHLAPGFEGGRGGSCGAVDVFSTAAGDRGQHRAVDRGSGLERLARDRRHGLAVDHVADAFAL
jgi:LPS-assembly protein